MTTDSILRSFYNVVTTTFVPFAQNVANAFDLLLGETQGYAINATNYDTATAALFVGGPVGGTVATIDTTTPANNLSNVPLDSSNLTQSGTSPKIVNWNTFSGPHNILTQSEDLTFAADWGSQNATVTANQTASPDGRTTADKFVASAGNAVHSIFRDVVTNFKANTVVTASVYVKPNTSEQYFELNPSDGTTEWFAAIFDIQAGTVVGNSAGAAGTYISSSITNVGGGWFRCSVTGSTTSADGLGPNFAIVNSASPTFGSFGEVTWNPAGTETIFLWGAQLNIGSLTDYVPTTAVVSGGVRWTPHNLLLQSQTIATAPWGDGAGSTTANTTVAPDGTLTGDTYTEGGDELFQLIDLLDATYTASVFLKAGTCTWMRVLIDNLGTDENTGWFNLVTGQIGTTSTTGVATNTSSTITPVGNGWYRCTVTGTRLADNSQISIAATTGDGTHTRDTGKTINCWGAQVNRGPVATPYLVTTSAARIGIPQGYNVANSKFGILIEPAATNLALRSQELDAAEWTEDHTVLTGNAATAPDGSSTAGLLAEDSATNFHTFFSTSTIASAGATITLSIYAKQGPGTRYCILNYSDAAGTDQFSGYFNLISGAVNAFDADNAATVAGATITAVGNGWYRLTVTGTIPDATGVFSIALANGVNDVASYVGDGVSGVYLWGAQLETGTVATSYIPTVAATSTRSADSVSALTSTMPFSATVGTAYVDYLHLVNPSVIGTGGQTELMLGDGTTAERIELSTFNDGLIYAEVVDGSVGQVSLTFTDPGNIRHQSAFAWQINNFGFTFNGATALPDTSGTLPTITTMFVGKVGADLTHNLIGYIYRIVYSPRRVIDAELPTWRYNYP